MILTIAHLIRRARARGNPRGEYGFESGQFNNKRKEMMIFNNLIKQTPELLKRGAWARKGAPRAWL